MSNAKNQIVPQYARYYRLRVTVGNCLVYENYTWHNIKDRFPRMNLMCPLASSSYSILNEKAYTFAYQNIDTDIEEFKRQKEDRARYENHR